MQVSYLLQHTGVAMALTIIRCRSPQVTAFFVDIKLIFFYINMWQI